MQRGYRGPDPVMYAVCNTGQCGGGGCEAGHKSRAPRAPFRDGRPSLDRMAPVRVVEHRVAPGDGSWTTVDEYLPATPSDEAILFLPALGVPISYYRPLFEDWAGRGRHVFGLEVRGRPRSSTADVRRHDWGYATIIEQDIPAALQQTPLGGIPKLTVVGHSLGGQLALLATGAGMLHPQRITTIASGTSSYLSVNGWWPRLARRIVTPFAVAVTAVVGHFPGDRVGFGDRQPKTMIGDWHREAWHGRYAFAGTDVDYEAALQHIDVPVLMITFDSDRILPPAGADLLAARVGPTRPERLRLTAADNGGMAYDHVRWVRQSGELVLDRLESWLNRRFDD